MIYTFFFPPISGSTMHRVYTEIKQSILKLSGRYLIQDRKSYVLSIKVPVQLHLWNSIKYSKINEKHELLYKNIISWPLKYSDPWKQHVTAKKSKTSVSTTLIGLMSNFLWRQTFKNLRKKKIIRMGEKMTVRKRELNPSIWKQTRTFSSVHLRSGTFISFTTFSNHSCKEQICTGHGVNIQYDHI